MAGRLPPSCKPLSLKPLSLKLKPRLGRLKTAAAKAIVFALSTGLFATPSLAFISNPHPVVLAAKTLGDLPLAREGAAAAATSTALYLVGGESNKALVGQIDVLDFATGSWRSLPTRVEPRRDFGVAIVGHHLIIVGGRTAVGASAVVERLDLRTGRLTHGRPLPTPRVHAGVAAHDGLVYVAGGTLGWGRVATVEMYNPTTDTWYRGTDLTQARDPTLVELEGDLYALGGFVKKGVVSMRAERLSARGDRWVRTTDLPAPTSTFAAVALDGRILTFGDWADPGRVLMFDPGTARWSWLRGAFSPRHRPAAAVLAGHAVVVGGSEAGSALVTVEAFTLVP